jgi:signal peptidase I
MAEATRRKGGTEGGVEHLARYVKRAIATVVVLAVLAGAGLVALSLSRGTWMVTPVLSGSMRPGFSVGGVVVSQRVPIGDIGLRDVIVFQNPIKRTEQMIHRIVKLTRLPDGAIKIKTQGDANPIPDPWTVTIDTKFVYRIRWSLPLLGYAAVAYQNHRGILIAVAGLLLVLVAAGMWLGSGARKKAPDATEETDTPTDAVRGDGDVPSPSPGVPALADVTFETFETFEQVVRRSPVAASSASAGAPKGAP